MAKKLSSDIKSKIGNCFEVANIEKEKGEKNKVRFQASKYILVHVVNEHGANVQWLLTKNELIKLSYVAISDKLKSEMKKGHLYDFQIGFFGCNRYLVKLQNLDMEEIVLSVGKSKAMDLELRAKYHPESIVALQKSILDLFR